jgi:hypothetical protein
MGLKSLMEYLQKRVPNTPALADTPANAPCKPFGEAANDPDNTEPPVLDTPLLPGVDPPDWRELAQAYHAHHFGCVVCIAAGRGARYGLRCGVGTALWCSYSEAT